MGRDVDSSFSLRGLARLGSTKGVAVRTVLSNILPRMDEKRRVSIGVAATFAVLGLTVAVGWYAHWAAEEPLPTFTDICRYEHGQIIPAHSCLAEWVNHTADLRRTFSTEGPLRHASAGGLSWCATSQQRLVGWKSLRFSGEDNRLFTDDDVLPTEDDHGITTVGTLRRLAAEPVPDSPAFGLVPAGTPGCALRTVGSETVRICVSDGIVAVARPREHDLVCDVAGCLCGVGTLPDPWEPSDARQAFEVLLSTCGPQLPGVAACLERTAP